MYSDSDNDDRDASLDIRFDTNALGDPSTNAALVKPNITPDSKYDRSFSFSDDDENENENENDNIDASNDQTPPRVAALPAAAGTPIAQGFDRKPRYVPDPNDGMNSPRPDQTNTIDDTYRTNNNSNIDAEDDFGAATSEMSSLFALISNFQPEPVEISVHWKPFIPDLVPAIGTIDAFIKVPRPDAEVDDLGLVVLDEPSIAQSNPQVLKMELREQYGITSPGNESDGYIGFIENVQKNRKALDSWLESIEEIHRNRPPPTLIYSSTMPELEDLMEPWDESFEETLRACPLPTADLDCSLEEYAKVICALLEIPVKGNIIESLHHLFTLYAQFEGNHYFKSQIEQS